MKIIIKLVFITLCALLHSAQANDQERISFIQNHFDEQSRHSALWQNGWLGVVSVNAAINAHAYHNADNRKQRIDSGTALAVGALGITSSVQKPIQVHHYADQLSGLPGNTEQQLHIKRLQAEKWLAAAANREQHERSRSNRLTSTAVHALAGLLIATEGSGEKEAVASFLGGILFSELKIRSAPNKSLEALTNYRLGLLSSTQKNHQPYWQFQFNGQRLAANLYF